MRFHSITDIGRLRSLNQDSMFATEEAVGPLPNLFVVADGMGGHNAGEYASAQAVRLMTQYICAHESEQPAAVLERGIEEANARLYREASEDASKSGMGTTVVAATVMEGHLLVANVGDSRLYVVKSGRLRQMTRDHSVVEEMVRMGKITEEEALHHPKKRMITRAVGAEEDVRVDLFDFPTDGVEEILLCTDGLTNMVTDKEIEEILLSGQDARRQAEHLVAAANQGGGRDNITVIVINQIQDEVKEC